MTTRQDFLAEVAGSLRHVRGIAEAQWEGYPGYPAVFFDIAALSDEERWGISDQLDDILSEMSSPGFDEEHVWTNEDFALIAVLGAPMDEDGAGDGEYPYGLQPEAFLLHSNSSGAVHIIEMSPADAEEFAELPVVAASLAELRGRLAPRG